MVACPDFHVYVAKVGDGLAAGITVNHKSMQIDCGSTNSAILAFKRGLCRIRPDVFLLSHFHSDHYNGLQYTMDCQCQQPLFNIKQVYFPRLPDFSKNREFLLCMFAMNHRVMGDTTGSMEFDFLRLIQSLNRGLFSYKALSCGERVVLGGTEFEVLWPPRVISTKQTLKVIAKSMEDFNHAIEEDDVLKKIYESLGKSEQMRPYSSGKAGTLAAPSREGKTGKSPSFPKTDLPDVVKQANKSLRAAANHLSLVLHNDDRLLFLGDIEKTEIKSVVSTLKKAGKCYFDTIITPHHGTHWHNNLYSLCCRRAVSSVGRLYFTQRKTRRKSLFRFDSISDFHHITCCFGEFKESIINFKHIVRKALRKGSADRLK